MKNTLDNHRIFGAIIIKQYRYEAITYLIPAYRRNDGYRQY